MLFYSNNARESAIKNIERLNVVIGQISGDQISYIDAVQVTRYLDMLKNEIWKEIRKDKK